MSGSPLDPLVHLVTTLAVAVGAGVLVTLVAVVVLRWRRSHWTWTLPGVLLGPALWSVDQGAATLSAATALFATATGARWHHDDLRHGGERAQDARDRRTPLDSARRRLQPDRARPRGWPRRARARRAHPGRARHRPAHARRWGDGVGQDSHPGVDRQVPHPGRPWRGRDRPQGRRTPAWRARARRPPRPSDPARLDPGRPRGL